MPLSLVSTRVARVGEGERLFEELAMPKINPKEVMKMEILEDSMRKVARISSLTEQYAVARSGQDQFLMSIIRAASFLQRTLMTNGFGTMADSANQIAMVARRGGTPPTKARNLREHLVNLNSAVERGIQALRRAAIEAQREAR